MTSTTGKADTAQHPDVSEISDLTEGLLAPPRAAVIRRHLDACPLCADVRDSLTEIRGLLGTLPGPPRMPAEIAGRIDAALAAEALLHATAPESSAPVSRETSRPSTETRSPSPTSAAPSVTAPAASGTSTAPTRPEGHPRGAGGPGRSSTTRRRRRVPLLAGLGAAFGAAILGTSLFLSQGGGVPSAGDSSSFADTKKADALASAPLSPFSGTPMEERVQSLLTEEASAGTPKGLTPESTTDGVTAQERSGATDVPACVLAGTGRTDGVLAQEKGEYEGTSAYLVVLTDPADAQRVKAYVLDAACAERSARVADSAATLLTSGSYPRP
ncbi:hypothetical protein [Streptomyces sp. NPDC003327]